MELFNIGIPELLLILVIMLIVLGPDQTIRQMKNLARFVRRLVRSPLWADIVHTSREIKDLPNRMMRDTGLDEEVEEMNRQIHTAVDMPPVRITAPDTHDEGDLPAEPPSTGE